MNFRMKKNENKKKSKRNIVTDENPNQEIRLECTARFLYPKSENSKEVETGP